MALQVGIVGGGQLARMMIAPAVEIGIDVRVLAEQPAMSAGLAATAVGDYRDLDTVLAFAKDVDVITFDHEHVPQDVLRGLVAAGVAVHPGPDALAFAQDKIDMRTKLAELGLPQPDWAAVTDAASLDAFIADHGGRAVVKTPRGGYDGKGVRVVSRAADVTEWMDGLEEGAALLAEELVPFTRELAQQVARRPSGELVVYPVVETVQEGGVCAEAIAPAPRSAGRLADVAAEIGEAIATGLGVTGMLAVELFQTDDERLLVNELAMRPHNSGHWTQDGAITSQFEQHLRAVLDLPLGATALRAPHVVMVNILGGPSQGSLGDRLPAALAAHPSAKVHTYGKDPRPGRKVGHINVAGDDLDEIVYEARAAAAFFLD
ncbi:5-(carboxyamino)imidazole ribonucleotide synthase [Microbacterium sp. SORGH_AS 505]|uniref:5-(carboxyamino)imidazole ribonucleotide synthase n=1 Tax=Microbacterium sp. SORGH_AS_0505 TaxID=3041770 RepID=UPI00278850CC|nr:5-(carboxyamino)imidazole ribonucleotide synthase [Microbacterium sp. SORGH_AS_0505]MDQ1125264.1 5-(carboxyamino)imidazole ribonucleotide synthase [Microbacterium sp. SORGH_AS_0505]